MSTEHETPAGSLDNVPRFLNCQKILEKHWILQSSKIASPCFTQRTLWRFPSTLEEHLSQLWLPNFFLGKFPSLFSNRITVSILNGKYQQPKCILATDIPHLQDEQLTCSVFTLNVCLFVILSKTGMCWQFLVTVHLIKFQDNLSSWSHMFHMDKHTTGC